LPGDFDDMKVSDGSLRFDEVSLIWFEYEGVVLVLLQSPSLLDQAVVYDGLVGEAGGLQQDQPGSLN
jgi:hypothetical protein